MQRVYLRCNEIRFHPGQAAGRSVVADFAATCLKGDALRWWTGLNSQIQGSWAQLRNHLAYRYRPSFYGRSGEEAEKFVHNVYERAYDSGKQGNNQWIANFVALCFKGGALRWFSSLDSIVQNDWRLLQEAIFTQYPTDAVDYKPRTVPTPAATQAPPSSGNPLKRGLVQVRRRNVSDIYYLSQRLGVGGHVERTRIRVDALEVMYNPTLEDAQALIVPDSQLGKYDMLAMGWLNEDLLSSDNSGTLCAFDSSNSLGSMTANSKSVQTVLWKLSGEQSSPPSGQIRVIPTIETGETSVYTPDESDSVYFYPQSSHRAVSIFIEPL